jgi:peptidoglycan hydrolase CwlO-like protein
LCLLELIVLKGEIKELQGKVDGAEKELQRKDKQLGETRLTMSNLSGDLEKGFEMLTERDKTIASLLVSFLCLINPCSKPKS